ncbi:L-serine ammonia-lyase [Alteromonas sediminis]|uniref:L-serine dehydratase n=1 Tax=Alteromonas sediminis TaxID=2259342 RepID=A0A3N5Y8E6_9ALTE|nr:L-serine ammonia-lyase [Alteromonas sediminis]RPJ67319.1 L-serine ammonia-lyase [Alteromonas sediminis]
MISVFDMFSVGIGPSSSHTVGPMRAAAISVLNLHNNSQLTRVKEVQVELYGSLGQTGKGHGTGKAVILGLMGLLPESVDVEQIDSLLLEVDNTESIRLNDCHSVPFPKQGAIVFHRRKSLPKHANALTFHFTLEDGSQLSDTYYSIGGGFIVNDRDFDEVKENALSASGQVPYPFKTAETLLSLCKENGMRISSLMLKNEVALVSGGKHEEKSVTAKLHDIWKTMKACIERGMGQEGILPGGLKVVRRAPALYRRLQCEHSDDPMQTMDWVNLFALSVNEENAAGGRVVTAPTNGAAGIIPAVMAYFNKFVRPLDEETAARFLLTAGAIGILYKENASISGAEVGCQGEVGVACSMAAGALTEILGGSVQAVENAAEIGMEHNLGLTCDPVGGLVQVPCIERNAMGAIKAINASRLALRGSGDHKVSLDKVIKTMRDTGNDMKTKYKETARGGLAVNIIEC